MNLGFLDEQYRSVEQPLAPLVEEIQGSLAPGARVLCPGRVW